MRLKVGYPDPASERDIIRNHALERASQMQPVLSRDELLALQMAVEKISVDDALVSYMLAIVDETRRHDQLALGVSPRAAQSLYRASQALAMVEERDYVIPDDIKRLAVPIFAHRVVMHQRSGLAARSSEAAERVIEEILNRIEVPL
jgi:MoxR-like ATPase